MLHPHAERSSRQGAHLEYAHILVLQPWAVQPDSTRDGLQPVPGALQPHALLSQPALQAPQTDSTLPGTALAQQACPASCGHSCASPSMQLPSQVSGCPDVHLPAGLCGLRCSRVHPSEELWCVQDHASVHPTLPASMPRCFVVSEGYSDTVQA